MSGYIRLGVVDDVLHMLRGEMVRNVDLLLRLRYHKRCLVLDVLVLVRLFLDIASDVENVDRRRCCFAFLVLHVRRERGAWKMWRQELIIEYYTLGAQRQREPHLQLVARNPLMMLRRLAGIVSSFL